jgi:hypothetical protein
MNTIELIHYSLGFAFQVLEAVVADLTQDQADWTPPGTASPIGALYWHTIAYSDQLIHEYCMPPLRVIPYVEWLEARCAKRDLNMGQAPLRLSAGWQEKALIVSPPENPQDPFSILRPARAGLRVDLPMMHGYAQATAEALLSRVASLTPEELKHTICTPIGDFALDQFVDSFIIWHINAHCGEIAALKGVQGLKGYPW